MNNVTIFGRITADIEIKLAGETKVTNFQVAVQRNKEIADFLPVVAFGSTAEYLEKYAAKGTPTIIEGRLQSRNYETKEGVKRTAYEIVANRVTITKYPDAPEAADAE